MNHNKVKRSFIYLLCLFASLSACQTTKEKPVEDISEKPVFIQVAQRDALVIGQKIWMNEGSAKIENLTAWNEGENFASLGISHFIWYPQGVAERFTETFPNFLTFVEEEGKRHLPVWLEKNRDCPWTSRRTFMRDQKTEKMESLRQFLLATIPLQVQFMIRRLERALPTMLETVNAEKKEKVRSRFYQVAATPEGVYALVDYVNFKGEGTAPSERYQGKGWGLLQVLDAMTDKHTHVLDNFADAADYTLTQRIKNSPQARGESRWLAGWRARITTYRPQ